jgi:pSer/pThr/pTyr-binding forkhead associated (FHA) protein
MGKMIIIGGLEPREVPLPSAQFTVGRFYSPENNVLVALDEKSVSRKHAVMRIAAQGREFYIQDVGSTYGTHIIAEGRFDRLQPGMDARVYNQDVIQFRHRGAACSPVRNALSDTCRKLFGSESL